MRFLRTRFSKVVASLVVGVPVIGIGGLSAYVQYRERTKPARHTFRPVIDAEGNLLLADKIVPRASNLSVCLRVVHLLCIFVPVALLYLIMSLRASWYQVWLNLLLKSIERAGPVFVKIGQWSCTREDLFSPAVRNVFKKLYNEVDVHPFNETMQILQEDLNADPMTVFSSISPTTVGSGSIGQVHMAHLKHSNKRVVIKVMHPNIIETIVRDFAILNHSASLFHHIFPSLARYDFPALAFAFSNHLAAQLDFRIEAENLEQFRQNFRQEHYVEFPEPIISTQRMLVETFCEGEPANPEFLATLPVHARDALATKGLNTWCQMLLRDNFIHGDMHPGNILIDCTDMHEPTISLIDVGLCQQLTEGEADLSRTLMESFVRWNAAQCTECIWNMTSKQGFANREKFESDMAVLFKGFRPHRNEEQAITRMLQSIFECIRENKVQMDPPYVSLLFSVLVLESFIMNLNPNFNIVRHTAPWLVSEGFVSKGVVKNLVKSRWDTVKRECNIFAGRVDDKIDKCFADKNRNVRFSLEAGESSITHIEQNYMQKHL